MRTAEPADLVRRPFRRHLGTIVILVGIAVTFGLLLTASVAWVKSDIKPFSVVPREKYQRAPGPLNTLTRGMPPKSSEDNPMGASPDIKAVQVFRDSIRLLSAGKAIRVIPTPQPLTTLDAVVKTVHDPAWLSSDGNGTITFKVGVVIDRGADIAASAPLTQTIMMENNTSVLLGVEHEGRLTLNGVHVTSDAPQHPAAHLQYRPAVVASNKGAMDIVNSTFTNLGWDWNAAYGVSWVNGATGMAIGSTFAEGFIGVYTSSVTGIQFINDRFVHNDLYGLDPHTGSNNLLVDGAVAEHNAAHGIIFSQDVTASTVTNSTSRYNGENGIMMDLRSSGNTLSHNISEHNRGDGIVLAESPGTVVAGNTIRDNRVGIRMSPVGSVTLGGNRITENTLATEGVQLSPSDETSGNGGQYRVNVLIAIWAGAVLFVGLGTLLLFVGNGWLRRREGPVHAYFA